ncbi:MAG TPA: folylpolyglutamate synthase/dihydrofolate synthase family protein [Candidatus Acidoferrales bacterium]|nr:folylpolyglutamate synthase/dihydrofolate synthase family protein [Candidatus Acidoferrales bacterium]
MATNEYAEVLAWLYRLETAKGMDFKLERVTLALKNLGDPQTRFAAAHVAGTNGKGSVAAMLHAMFSAAGYRVGLYTSPHLVSFTERVRIGAETITEPEVVDLAREIRTAATVRGIDLTFFEFVTVMAFLHFARRGVDLAVVEVGLGGRLDATNVLDPAVAVITSIGLDHEEFLGNTLASVAAEKAGIIKPGRPVIVGRVPPVARDVIERAASERRADAFWAAQDFLVSDTVPFRFRGLDCEFGDLTLALRGAYQHDNAAVALAALALLRRAFPIGHAAIRRGLAEVRWPGRLDVVQTAPLVVLDGAHNADAVATLRNELPSIVGARPVHLLFGVMRDKQWQPMVEVLGPMVSSATLTTALPPRGAPAALLARAFERYCPVRVVPDPMRALETSLQSIGPDATILATGSLFLVGTIYPHFLSRRGQHALFTVPATLHP